MENYNIKVLRMTAEKSIISIWKGGDFIFNFVAKDNMIIEDARNFNSGKLEWHTRNEFIQVCLNNLDDTVQAVTNCSDCPFNVKKDSDDFCVKVKKHIFEFGGSDSEDCPLKKVVIKATVFLK